MQAVKIVNAVLAFSLEVVMCAAYGMWGYSLSKHTIVKWLLAVAIPGVVAVIWGLFAAPMASHLLKDPAHFLLELGLTLLAAFLLFSLGHRQWGIAIAILAVISQTITILVGSVV